MSERPPLSLGSSSGPALSPRAVGTRERRDADGMRAVSRKLEAVLWCAPPPPFCHRGLFGVDFGLTAPRLRTVAESGMDRCCLGTERAGFSAPHPCPDPDRLSRATPALSGTEVSGTPVLFRGGAVGAPGKGLGAGLLREGLLEPGSAGGAGLGSLLPRFFVQSRDFLSPSPRIVRSPYARDPLLSEPRVRSAGQKPLAPRLQVGRAVRTPQPRVQFPVCKTAGRPGLAGLTLRWPADVPTAPPPCTPPWPRGRIPPGSAGRDWSPHPLLAGVCWCAPRWRY